MAVHCANCGEELMGAVNRCWRCGREFVGRRTDGDLPPIRRAPVFVASSAAESSEILMASLAGTQPTAPELPGNAITDRDSPFPTTMRRGSPFGDRGTAVLGKIPSEPARSKQDESLKRQSRYQRNGGAAVSAALTVPVGLASLAAAFSFPLAGILLALLGVGLGIWGLASRRRGLAIAGLLLCCVCLTVATICGSIEVYTNVYGVAPW